MRISDWSSDVCSSDLIAGAEAIDPGLDALSLDDTIAFVRGFMLFSMLANLAEDRQGVAAEPEATVAAAIEKLKADGRSEEHTSELQSLMRISYAVFCLKKKKTHTSINQNSSGRN